MKIDSLTICVHCGCSQEIVQKQINALLPVAKTHNIIWNKRIERYPKTYPSYSQLVNHSICTSPTEWVVSLGDRVVPKAEELIKMIELLESGFPCVMMYNVAFMGFSKELIRTMGWFDERFLHGGWEDRDWLIRLSEANLGTYESAEGSYDLSWKSPLNTFHSQASTNFWHQKWDLSRSDVVRRLLPEEEYPHWNLFLGSPRQDIKETWLDWSQSKLNINYNKPNCAPAGSSILGGRKIIS